MSALGFSARLDRKAFDALLALARLYGLEGAEARKLAVYLLHISWGASLRRCAVAAGVSIQKARRTVAEIEGRRGEFPQDIRISQIEKPLPGVFAPAWDDLKREARG